MSFEETLPCILCASLKWIGDLLKLLFICGFTFGFLSAILVYMHAFVVVPTFNYCRLVMCFKVKKCDASSFLSWLFGYVLSFCGSVFIKETGSFDRFAQRVLDFYEEYEHINTIMSSNLCTWIFSKLFVSLFQQYYVVFSV